MRQALAQATRTAVAAATSGGSQNFLGAAWVDKLLRATPVHSRERVALFLLSLSPHYFYSRDRRGEAERNSTSRAGLVADVLLPHLAPGQLVLDYGCGPGYMAAAVAKHVREVEAVDVSRGVLACARVLNGAPNIRYESPAEAARREVPVDLVYSFAVFQHLSDRTVADVLGQVRRRLRPDGTLVIHYAVPGEEWRTEADWRSDASVKGRAKLRFGLHCFGRSDRQMCDMVTGAGFRDPRTDEVRHLTTTDDDIAEQRLLVARG
jgi:SAM-dependent methyltransferase